MRRIVALLLVLAAAGWTACAPALPPARPPETRPGRRVPASPDLGPAGNGVPAVTVHATVQLHEGEADPIAATAFVTPDRGWLAAGSTILATEDGGRTWTPLHVTDSPVLYLDFTSPLQGWALTVSGLFRTRDGGATWQWVPRMGPAPLSRIDFVDAARGWGGSEAGLFATVDGGRTWSAISDPCADYAGPPQPFSFIDAGTGWVLCGGGAGAGQQHKRLYRTDDGGRQWRLVADTAVEAGPGGLPGGGYVSDLCFLDRERGWFTEARGGLFATVDGGQSWVETPVVPGGEQFLREPRFPTPEAGYVVSTAQGRPVLLSTRDGGATWAQVYPHPDTEPRVPMAVIDAQTAVTAGTLLDPGAILLTADAGRTWQQVASLPGETVLGLSFADARHGWAVTERWDSAGLVRSLYRTADGGATWFALPPGPRRAQDLYTHVSFVDDRTGFVASGWGHLSMTRDGGLSFLTVGAADSSSSNIRFVSPEVGWRITDFTLQATADGGQTWTPVPLAARAWQFDLLPGGIAWVVAEDCEPTPCRLFLFATPDAGRTWVRHDLGEVTPRSVWLVDPQSGWLADDRNHVYTTADGGRTWVQQR